MGVVTVTVTLSDPLEKVLLSVLTALYSAGLGILVAEGEMLPLGEAIVISLKWKCRWPPRHFGLSLSMNQQRVKGSSYAG